MPTSSSDLANAERETADNSRLNLTVALSYGARAEIAAAARAARRGGARRRARCGADRRGVFAGVLATAGMPDPDLLIRTSGEQRLSNFLLWQAAYAELCSSTCCGRISAPSISPLRWPSTHDGSGGSVPALAERSAGRWADLGTRVLSALVLAPIAISSVWLGGIAFGIVVWALMFGLAVEWIALCRRSHWLPLYPMGLAYVGAAGVAVLWLRSDPVAGRAHVLFLLSSSGPAMSAPI